MKKFIIAIMFVMMISSTSFGHDYCGQKCKEVYKEVNDSQTLFYVAEGCAAHRAFQEFKLYEMDIGGVDVGYFVDKINEIPNQTNATVIWLAQTPNSKKPLEVKITLILLDFPQPNMQMGIVMDVKFKDDDYINFDIKTTSEISGRGYRTSTVYGFFDFMVDYLAE